MKDRTETTKIPGTEVTVYVDNDWLPCAEGCPGWFVADDYPVPEGHLQGFEPICKCDMCGRFRYDDDAALWNFKMVFAWHRNQLGPGGVLLAADPRNLPHEAVILENARKRFLVAQEAESVQVDQLRAVSVNLPQLFQRRDFIEWLNATDRERNKATWHRPGTEADEWSDTFVWYGGDREGSNTEMPGWDLLCAALEAKGFDEECIVRITNHEE